MIRTVSNYKVDFKKTCLSNDHNQNMALSVISLLILLSEENKHNINISVRRDTYSVSQGWGK